MAKLKKFGAFMWAILLLASSLCLPVSANGETGENNVDLDDLIFKDEEAGPSQR